MAQLGNTRAKGLVTNLLFRSNRPSSPDSDVPNDGTKTVTMHACPLLDTDGYEVQRRALANHLATNSLLIRKSKKLLHWLRGSFGLMGGAEKVERHIVLPSTFAEDCPVCLEKCGPGRIIRYESCRHWTCDSCLESHYHISQKNGTINCPLCRAPVKVPLQCIRVATLGFSAQPKQVTGKLQETKKLIAEARHTVAHSQIVIAFQHKQTFKLLTSEFPDATLLDKITKGSGKADETAQVCIVSFERLARGSVETALDAHIILYELAAPTTVDTVQEWTSVLQCAQITALYTEHTVEQFIVLRAWSVLGSRFYACDLQTEGPIEYPSASNIVNVDGSNNNNRSDNDSDAVIDLVSGSDNGDSNNGDSNNDLFNDPQPFALLLQ